MKTPESIAGQLHSKTMLLLAWQVQVIHSRDSVKTEGLK